MEQNTNKVLADVADAITSKEVNIEFDIYPRNRFQRWLQKKGWKPSKKKYVMRPIVIGNLQRISRQLLLIDIDYEKIEKGFSIEMFHHLSRDHAETMIEVLAIGIHNQKTEPSEKLKEQIRYNLAAPELFHLLVIMLQQMNPSVFIHAIISTRGLNVLEKSVNKKDLNEVSPSIQERSIAPGK